MEEQSVPLSDSQPKMTRRLGRGLNALLGSGTEEPQRPPAIRLHAPEQDEISVELIERNPFQPRREFDQQAIDELAESIRKHGILQPLLVRSQGGDGYQLVAGERRWRACQQIGMETVPCRVVELEDKQVCEAAIEENLKRQDLNMIEKAVAFKEYLEKFGGTIEELAKQLSMNRSTISNMLRLLDLPETVQDAVRKEQISGGHARALLALSADAQTEMCQQIQSQQLSVRKTEEAVRALVRGDAPAAAPTKPERPEMTPHVLSLQDGLREHYAARVEIKLKKKDAGQVVIHFDSNDDFERIVGLLRKAG